MDGSIGVTAPGVEQRESGFRVARHPLAQAAAREFRSGDAQGTLRFFEAVLPQCRRMLDFGAHVGFTALSAAQWEIEVFAFEPNPTSHELLARNVAENPELAPRIRLFRHGLGDSDGSMSLYSTATADAGATLFRDIERETSISAKQEEVVPVRDASSVLRELEADRQTLVKMDIEGAEYLVLPAIAALLAERKPWLHVSFHPFNLVAGSDPYRNALLRLRCSLQAAEALASYRYVHVFSEDEGWSTIEPEDRMDFLRHYLLKPKTVPRIATAQYGFVGALGFSEDPLPEVVWANAS